jgi:Polysaccharide lyase
MTLVYSQNFDMSFAAVPQLQANGTIVTGAASPSGIAGRMDIVGGVFRSRIVDTDPPTATGVRAECVFTPAALGDEDWIRFEVLVNRADWDDTGTCSVCQIHNKDTIAAAVNLVLVVKHGGWSIWTPAVDPPVEQGGFQQTQFEFLYDRWNEVVIHAKWLNNTNGFLEVFINNVSAFRRFDVGTAYNGDTPYFKLGAYDAPHQLGFGTKTAYYRNLKMYKGLEAQHVVMDRGPKPRRRRTA